MDITSTKMALTNHRGEFGITPATKHPTCPPCPLSLGHQVVKTTPDHKPGGEWHHCEPVVSPGLAKIQELELSSSVLACGEFTGRGMVTMPIPESLWERNHHYHAN